MSSQVLVTGGAGYLGSILCEHLLAAGHRVTVLDSLVHQTPSLLHLSHHEGFTFVRGDVRDERVVAECMREVDVIIPLAAVVGAPACDAEPELARAVNREAISTLNRLRSDQQLVIFPNTNSGYGTKSGSLHCTEESPLEPISLYGRTKVESEAELLGGANAISLRFATLFGASPRMRVDLMLNHFVLAAVRDGYLVLFEKDFLRNFVHVRDAADAFLHAIAHRDSMAGRAFNVGLDSANLSKEGLAREIQKEIPTLYLHFAEIGSDPDKRNYVVSNQRLREAGFEARRTILDGIRELRRAYAMLPAGGLRNA